MSEEQVTRFVLEWLTTLGWAVLDYDFPGGGTGRKFHIGQYEDKTTGIVIPDVIAFKDGCMIIMENKAKDTKSDYDKISEIASGDGFLRLLCSAYPDKQIERIIYGIAFSGKPKFVNIAGDVGVSFVVQVGDDGGCKFVYGHL